MVDPQASQKRVRAKVRCLHGHEHDCCILLPRAVHPDLRCMPQAPQGYVESGGAGCVLPGNLVGLALRELQDNYQESRRRGWILIAA